MITAENGTQLGHGLAGHPRIKVNSGFRQVLAFIDVQKDYGTAPGT